MLASKKATTNTFFFNISLTQKCAQLVHGPHNKRERVIEKTPLTVSFYQQTNLQYFYTHSVNIVHISQNPTYEQIHTL